MGDRNMEREKNKDGGKELGKGELGTEKETINEARLMTFDIVIEFDTAVMRGSFCFYCLSIPLHKMSFFSIDCTCIFFIH